MSTDHQKETPLIEVRRLKVYYPMRRGFLSRKTHFVKAVDDVSFSIPRGQTVGLVGESGSGKSSLGKALVRLAPVTEGEIFYNGQDLTKCSEQEFFQFRKKIQTIFQDPYSSLNPRLTVGSIIGEPLEIHFPGWKRSRREDRVAELLSQVGLHPDLRNRYPHQFSGGQRQRIGIARALAVEPECIICDESVSALDVSVQAQIINLLQDLQEALHLTYLFIAHDLAVVEHISDYVLVMSEGKLVEQADADAIYQNPQHPYTRKLLDAIPKMPTVVAACREEPLS